MTTTQLTILGFVLLFLGTTLGSAVVLFVRKELSERLNTLFLGFAGGIMIAASVWSLLIPAIDSASAKWGDLSWVPAAIGFLIGGLFLVLLDRVIPHIHNHTHEEEGPKSQIHKTIKLFFAVTIHNIPEGIAVSIPILHATGSRRKALTYTMWTGLAEPIGAIFGIVFLLPFWTPIVSALLLAAVSGIMVFIALDELLPGAEEYGHHHYSIAGVILGMLIMAISLLIL